MKADVNIVLKLEIIEKEDTMVSYYESIKKKIIKKHECT